MFAKSHITHPLEVLTQEDYQDLKMSGLTDDQIVRAGHFSVTDRSEGKKLTDINHRGLVFKYLDPSNGLPYLNSKGKPFYRMKPRDWSENWTDPTEPPPKYLSPKDDGNKPYFSPLLQHFNRFAKKPNIDLDITEGEKKADLLAAHEVFSVGLAGVYGWLDKSKRLEELDIPPAQCIEDDEEALGALDDKLPQSRMIPELREALDWEYRRTNIVFDSDLNSKRQVRGALKDLSEALVELGAEPHIVRLPNEADGTKNGVDDFIVRHGLAAYNFLKKIAKPAFKKQKFHFPNEPTQYEKIVMAWSVIKDSWRYRPGVGWYNWTGTHWVNRTVAEFQESVTTFQDAQGWEFPVGKDLMLYQLQSRMLVRDDRWNPTHLLAFANGVLSVKDSIFTEGHNHEDFLTVVLPYDYSPLATCPTWIKFLREALGGDQAGIELLQAFIKWILLPKPRDRKAEIEKCLDLLGPKGSGKGTFLDIVGALVGPENVGAIGSRTFESSTHLSNLLDKKLSVASDAFGFLSNVGLFNEVVSNEPVPIKKLYKDPITTRLGTVVVRAYNRVLEVPDGAEGLDRRIIAVSFAHQPKVLNLELSEKLRAELPGIFTWAWSVGGGEMKRRISWAGSVESVASASVKRFEANNPEYSFLKLAFPTGNPQVKASDLYHSYQLWCKDDAGISPKKRRKFSEALQALGCEHRRTMDGYFYSIPPMDEFDVIKFMGLSQKITSETFVAENVHNVHAVAELIEKSGVSSMNILLKHEPENVHAAPENVHKLEDPTTEHLPDPPFYEGETFLWRGEEVRVERIGVATLCCHIVKDGPEQNRSYIRVPIEEAEKIKNEQHEHSHPPHEHSNVHASDRMFMPEALTNKEVQASHEHYEHSRPQTSLGETNSSQKPQSWTKALFSAIEEKPFKLGMLIELLEPFSNRPKGSKGTVIQATAEAVTVRWTRKHALGSEQELVPLDYLKAVDLDGLKFPYLGCEVGKLGADGQKIHGWVGEIREFVDEEVVLVAWGGNWDLNRAGKPIKDDYGLPKERWTRSLLREIYPRSEGEMSQSKKETRSTARNNMFIERALELLGRAKAIETAVAVPAQNRPVGEGV